MSYDAWKCNAPESDSDLEYGLDEPIDRAEVDCYADTVRAPALTFTTNEES